MPKKTTIIAGGSGFVGRHLTQALLEAGHNVIILTRTPGSAQNGVSHARWDGRTVSDWRRHLEGATAVINLTGRSIDCRPTKKNRDAIVHSRVDSVKALTAAVAQCHTPPRVFIQSSAVGYYGNGDSPVDETAAAGHDFLAQACLAWEEAFREAELPSTRKVTLRLGVVLGPDSGAFPILYNLTRRWLGGAAGSGKQVMSWVHVADVARICLDTIGHEERSGTFNAVTPEAVTNAEFMATLRAVLKRPWSPPVPAPMLRMAAIFLNTNANLILGGQRCVPAALQAGGFDFEFGKLEPALRDLCAAARTYSFCNASRL
jgi:uncharacterized protein (TIGR01777 family)